MTTISVPFFGSELARTDATTFVYEKLQEWYSIHTQFQRLDEWKKNNLTDALSKELLDEDLLESLRQEAWEESLKSSS